MGHGGHASPCGLWWALECSPTTYYLLQYLGTYIVPTAYFLASAYAYYLLLVPTPTTYCKHLLRTAYYLLLVPTTYYLLIVIQHSLS